MSLVDKLRKAREQTVEAGGFEFIVRRPTDVEMMRLRDKDVSELIAHVVGWSGVREVDVLAGGDGHPLAFDQDTAREWLTDRPDLLTPLVEAIMKAYEAHVIALGAAAKN